MNLFYALWADAINHERKKNGGENHWKPFLFFAMSVLLSFNIMVIYGIVFLFTDFNTVKEFMKIITFTESETIKKFLWATITLFIPSMLINYIFVFHKTKYQSIIENYEHRDGKLLRIYFLMTVLLFFGIGVLINLKQLF